MLSNLGSEQYQQSGDMKFMKDICLCISSIASIEIPKNQWEGFVEIMASQGNQSENLFFKFAGIYNLGLIMENTDLQEMQER